MPGSKRGGVVNGQLRDILTILPKLSVSQIQELQAIQAIQAIQATIIVMHAKGIPQQSSENTKHSTGNHRRDQPLAGFHGYRGVWQHELAAPETLSRPTPLIQAAHHASITPTRQDLTERQHVVLTLVLEGLPDKLIARRLSLAVNTVKQHVAAILKRLGARNRLELISRMKPFLEDNSDASVSPTSDIRIQPVGATLSCTFERKAIGLTNRQGTVLRHLLDGMSNKEIAQGLGLTENTVKEHVSAILLQLGACSRLQVISKMRQLGVAPSSSVDQLNIT